MQNKIYSEFLFRDFLSIFRDTFKIPKPDANGNLTKKQFTWEDQSYRQFMLEILTHLEPRFEAKGTVLFEELEEISEVIFVSKGLVDIGYEINKKKKYVLRYSNKVVIGAYNCCFNTRAAFIYRCKSDCSGYSIRKSEWKNILSEEPEIQHVIEKNVKDDYENHISSKVMRVKETQVKKLSKRSDLQQILVIADNHEGSASQRSEPKDEQEEEEEIDKKVNEYTEKVDDYGQAVGGLIQHVDRVNKMNLDLAVELERVYEMLAKEKAIAAQYE